MNIYSLGCPLHPTRDTKPAPIVINQHPAWLQITRRIAARRASSSVSSVPSVVKKTVSPALALLIGLGMGFYLVAGLYGLVRFVILPLF